MTRRALTLVELIITIVLAAIIGIPAGLILSEHLRGALRARDYTVAMSLARQEMERLDSLNTTNDFISSIISQPAAPVPGFPSYTRAVTVICLALPGAEDCTSTDIATQGVKQITIVVTKTGPGDVLATLVSYRTKHVFFGG